MATKREARLARALEALTHRDLVRLVEWLHREKLPDKYDTLKDLQEYAAFKIDQMQEAEKKGG